MQENKCVNCPEYHRCRDSWVSWVFLFIGLVATVSVRIVTLLMNIDPLFGQAAWYTGIIGFLLFFLYKFRVDSARAALIKINGLREKLSSAEPLSKKDSLLLASLICALLSGKERFNYFFIFASSAVALVLALYFDFLR